MIEGDDVGSGEAVTWQENSYTAVNMSHVPHLWNIDYRYHNTPVTDVPTQTLRTNKKEQHTQLQHPLLQDTAQTDVILPPDHPWMEQPGNQEIVAAKSLDCFKSRLAAHP